MEDQSKSIPASDPQGKIPPTEAYKSASELQAFLADRGGVDDNAVIAAWLEFYAREKCPFVADLRRQLDELLNDASIWRNRALSAEAKLFQHEP